MILQKALYLQLCDQDVGLSKVEVLVDCIPVGTLKEGPVGAAMEGFGWGFSVIWLVSLA